MTKTYAQLTKEIEALKVQAESVRKMEVAGVVSRIKEAISFYGLTAEDLGVESKPGGRKAAAKAGSPKAIETSKAVKKAKSAVRYRDSAGNTWGGMGPRPGWLKAALAAGQSLESLAVNGAGVDATPDADEAAPAKTAKPTVNKPVSVVKYKDAAGHSWSGRGPKPGWVKDAIAGGKTLEDLAA